MSSERKVSANRSNSRRSSGPRTAAGKSKASRNAVRHGLAALAYRQPVPSREVERLAVAICGDNHDSALLDRARLIANNELVLRAIREQQIEVIERLREPTAQALAKGDNSLKLAKGRFMQAWLANREIEARLPKVLEKYKDQMPAAPRGKEGETDPAFFTDAIIPVRLKALLEPPSSIEVEQRALVLARKQIEEQQRDEYQTMEAAIPDLIRLERYERRAWSRQKQAIRNFMNIKLMRNMNNRTLSERVQDAK